MSFRQPHRFSSKFYLVAILIFLFFLNGLALWFAANLDYNRTLERARITLEKTAVSLEERLKRTIIASEAVLHSRAMRIQEKGIEETISSVAEWERFRNAAQGLPDAGSLWFLDNKGNLLMDSTVYPSPQMNFSDREYFATQRDKGIDTYIGPVVKGRITNKYSFTISHRINKKNGDFLGIVVAAIETDDFRNFLHHISMEGKCSVAAFRIDGALILRQPMEDRFLGKTFNHLKLFRMSLEKPPSGIYETTIDSGMDGIKRLVAYRKVQDFPLVVATSIPTDSILQEWWDRVKVYSIIAIFAFLALIGLSWLVYRTTKREEEEKAKELSDVNLSLQTEITERKQVEEQMRHLISFPELNPNPVIELDASGEITYSNPSTKTILEGMGIDKGNLLVFLPEDIKEILAEWDRKAESVLQRDVTVGDRAFSETIFLAPQLNVVRVYGHDITKLKLTEQSLKKARDELELQVQRRTAQLRRQAELVDLAHDAIILTDMSGRIIFWSAGAVDTYAFSREEAIGNILHNLLQTKSRIPIKDIMDIIEREGCWEGELVHTCKTGNQVVTHSRWALRQNEIDGTKEIMEVNRDITSRKQAEESVKAERERLYTVLETLPAYVVLLTQDYRIPFANRVFRELFGDPQEKQCFQHLFGRTEPCETCETYKVLQTTKPQRWQWTGPNGHTYDINDFPFTDADGSGLILEMGIDITDRKRAEDQVRFANAYNRSLIEASPDPLVTISAEGLITDVNAATEKITGYSRHELIETDFSDYFTNPDKAKAGYEQVFRDGMARDYELEIRHKDGHVTPVLYNASVYRDETGKVTGVFAAARDISALRTTERALRESEERYRTAIESASDGIALVKEDSHTFVNRRFAEMFGYEDPSEIVGKPLSITVHPDDLAKVLEINRMRQEGEPVPTRYEFKGIKKDGTQRIIEVSAARTTYLGEPASLAYLRDITDYKNLEDQLRHSQKMEAIGVLAGGVAHDFNNILAAIIGFAEMVEEDIPLGKPKVEHVQRVINAASRGRELVQKILAFSRKTERARHLVSLSAITKETAQLLRASIPTTIEIMLDMAATSDTILATPVEVQQVLMNLSTNASLSMQEKGGILKLIVTDINIVRDSPLLEANMVPGEYVQLVVADTGTGMTPDVMERIFEPFFTTREVGQGTGMGLAVVYGIVKSLHGTIRVESEPGVGSTFTVLFPKAQVDVFTEKVTAEQSSGNKERVLFVDDEESLVEWGKALLERLGYEVIATNDSTKALEVFTSDPSMFDLVITDQTMPGITGLELAKEFLRIRPEIPIILCTGHSSAVTFDKLEEPGVREFLMKPLTRKELAEAIHRAFDKETKQ
jgi:PAS domain S-box-containing protein